MSLSVRTKPQTQAKWLGSTSLLNEAWQREEKPESSLDASCSGFGAIAPVNGTDGSRSGIFVGRLTFYAPSASTDGDSFIHFRREDVIVTGDVFNTTQYPFIDVANGGSVQGEIDALNAILTRTVFQHSGEGGKWSARRAELSHWLDSTNPDLSAFEKRGGKMIVAIGTNDTLASPGSQLDYYRAVLYKLGRSKVDSFARFYVLPQTGHGLSGSIYATDGNGKQIESKPIPNAFDGFALLVDWVEDGKAPGKSI